MKFITLLMGMLVCSATFAATNITIATVNNPQMLVMQKLTSHFEEKNPDINVKWAIMPEAELRRKVTIDIATGAGQYDVVTVGSLTAPIWASSDMILPLNDWPESYDVSDLIKPVRNMLSVDGTLYAVPFYAESSMTYYRTDLFKKAGVEMPEHPSWDQISALAKKLDDPANGVNGICLRGKAGWGLNMAMFDTMVNTYGGRWFDMDWQPQLTSDAWHNALNKYLSVMNESGPSGAVSMGFVETEKMFASGNCAMWIDATSAAGYVTNPKQSKVAGKVGFAWAPVAETKNGSHWLWSWALAIPKSTNKEEAARKFLAWATSKQYINLVGEQVGWGQVPPGTRYSTYKNPKYQKAAKGYAKLTLESINTTTPKKPTNKPVPYTGVQFVAIPEFQALGRQVGQNIAAALAGQMSAEQALEKSQTFVKGVMEKAGYYEDQ